MVTSAVSGGAHTKYKKHSFPQGRRRIKDEAPAGLAF